MLARFRLFMALAAIALAGPCLAESFTVTANSTLTFSPQHLTIHAGDTVTFANQGGLHNVAADDGSFRCAEGCDGTGGDGSPSSTAWSFTMQFGQAGTVGYHCEVHGAPGSGMFGTIDVLPAQSSAFSLGGYLSGQWYNPAQSGHGFSMEFTNVNNTLIAIWFVYAPDGSGPYWIYGQGQYDTGSNTVTVPAVLLTGSAFPPNFNAADVTRTPWGSMTFTFDDCSTGRVSWSSELPAYGSGSMPLTHLAQIAGTQCPQP